MYVLDFANRIRTISERMTFKFLVDSKDTFDTILQDQSAAQASQRQFDTNFSGLLSNMVAQAVGFWRVEDDAPIWSETQDSSSGPTAPHYEILFGDGYVDALPPPSSGNYFSAVSVGLTPNSRGSITLNSSDPFTFPNINPNLLGTKHDVYIAVQGSYSFNTRWLVESELTVPYPIFSGQEGARIPVQAPVQRLRYRGIRTHCSASF